MGEFPSKENQIKPGEVRNPFGRPVGSKNRATVLKQILESQALKTINKSLASKLGDDPDFVPTTIEEQVLASLVLQAISGDVAALKEVQDTVFGKLTDKVENKHSFTQMGRVIVGNSETGATELSFKVGEAPPEVKNDDSP